MNIKTILKKLVFSHSKNYWERRYRRGGNSGKGSYGDYAIFKAEVINQFLDEHPLESVIEFGCGDGAQLQRINYPHYTGFDVSESVIARCRQLFTDRNDREFHHIGEYDGQKVDLSLSLDVIYHLIEDDTYTDYMERLFSSSRNYVIIFSSNTDQKVRNNLPHIKHRKFTDYVDKKTNGWNLIQTIVNKELQLVDPSPLHADFFVYQKTD